MNTGQGNKPKPENPRKKKVCKNDGILDENRNTCMCSGRQVGELCEIYCENGVITRGTDVECRCFGDFVGKDCKWTREQQALMDARQADTNPVAGAFSQIKSHMAVLNNKRIFIPLAILPVLLIIAYFARRKRMAIIKSQFHHRLYTAMTSTEEIGRPMPPGTFAYIDPERRDVIKTLKDSQLNRVRQTSYEEFKAECKSTQNLVTSCSICVEDFVAQDQVKVLPCEHPFHAACVSTWLARHQLTCPLCRKDVLAALKRLQEQQKATSLKTINARGESDSLNGSTPSRTQSPVPTARTTTPQNYASDVVAL